MTGSHQKLLSLLSQLMLGTGQTHRTDAEPDAGSATDAADTIVRVGGAAGDGVASTGDVMARSFSRHGYHVNGYKGYQSVIRGGHTYYNVRAAQDQVPSPGEGADVVVAIDQQTARLHAPDIRPGGVLIHEAEHASLDDVDVPDDVRTLALPAQELAKELGNKVVANTVAVGAVAHLVGLEPTVIENMLEEQFGDKGEEIVQINHDALAAGIEQASELESVCQLDVVGDPRPLLPGNEALSLGAMAAGLGYYAAYPMTPASSILHYLAENGPEEGVVVKQMEDEIGVINSTIGAAWAGTRAMCGTSGGGFALMTEAVGMAGMAEVGIVVVNSMRGGPSTGLPTKTEQGDLWQMLGASQGDFPKAIIAPRDPLDAYKAAIDAHDIADRFQMPVILAMDLYVSETARTVDIDEIPVPESIDRSSVAEDSANGYSRYAVTETGISPRSLPGMPGMTFVASTDEHDEDANLISDVRAGLPESLEIRNQQMDKRMRKLDELVDERPAPELEGSGDPVIVCWGSTGAIVEETRTILAERGTPCQMLCPRLIHPFHSDEVEQLLDGRDFLVVEANHSGQFEDYLRMRTGLSARGHVRRYDGEPFTPYELADQIQEVISSW